MKNLLNNTLLVVISLTVALSSAEALSRWIRPIQLQAVALDEAGHAVRTNDDTLRLRPDIRFHFVGQEFDVKISHTRLGTRGPLAPSTPELLFLGDSFTYGWGVSDEQTFVALYCRAAGAECVNLGRPGTGTFRQLEILKTRLERDGWRPKEVRLVMLAMTRHIAYGPGGRGNDLGDNLGEGLSRKERLSGKEPALNTDGAVSTIQSFVARHRRWAVDHSNLVRLAYAYFTPLLRRTLIPPASPELRTKALARTRQALEELARLAHDYGFDYRIYLIYPLMALENGDYRQTHELVAGIVPEGRLVDTAPAFLAGDDPRALFYPFDGHWNPAGHRVMADLLLADTP